MRAIATINLIFIGGLVGLLVPHRVIDDGLERFHGPRGAAAAEGLTESRRCLDHPLALLLTSTLSVHDVRKVPDDPGPIVDPPVFLRERESPLAGYEVAVRVHTLFGIPARTITVREWSLTCV